MELTKPYEEFMVENGYSDLKCWDDQYACLMPLLFTTAIITGPVAFMKTGYDDRWCYHTVEDARTALLEWEASEYKGEPDGWHRHPSTGRRRDENGCETVFL